MIKQIVEYFKKLFPDPFAKWIRLEVDGKYYAVCFKENIFRGIYDVNFYKDDRKVDFNRTSLSVYPPLHEAVYWILRMAFITLKARFKNLYRRLRNRESQSR